MLNDDFERLFDPKVAFRNEKNAFVELGLTMAELISADIVNESLIEATQMALYMQCNKMYNAYINMINTATEDNNDTYH